MNRTFENPIWHKMNFYQIIKLYTEYSFIKLTVLQKHMTSKIREENLEIYDTLDLNTKK